MGSFTPTPKVAAGGIAGAVTILLVALAAAFGIVLEPTVASALTVVISFAIAWFKGEGNDGSSIDAGI